MSKRIDYNFDNYDKRLITVFGVISSYFVDILFNHIYNASKVNMTTSSSITDEYKKNVQAFIIEIKNNHDSYRKTINNIHDYFTLKTSYKTISFNRFVDNIVEHIIPEDYFEDLNIEEKDEILGSVICDLISGLGAYATSPELLVKIIDQHAKIPKITVQMLQQQGITILLAKRDTIHNQFLRKIGQVKDTVPITLVENMRNAIKKLVKEKTDLIVYIKKLENKIESYKDEITQLKKHEARQDHKIEKLQERNESKQSVNKRKKPVKYKKDNIQQESVNTERASSKIDKEKNKNALEEFKRKKMLDVAHESESDWSNESVESDNENLKIV